MARSNEYEIVDGQTGKVIANIWWNGKKVESDNDSMLKMASKQCPQNKTVKDGIAFIEALPFAFSNGYIIAREKKS